MRGNTAERVCIDVVAGPCALDATAVEALGDEAEVVGFEPK